MPDWKANTGLLQNTPDKQRNPIRDTREQRPLLQNKHAPKTPPGTRGSLKTSPEQDSERVAKKRPRKQPKQESDGGDHKKTSRGRVFLDQFNGFDARTETRRLSALEKRTVPASGSWGTKNGGISTKTLPQKLKRKRGFRASCFGDFNSRPVALTRPKGLRSSRLFGALPMRQRKKARLAKKMEGSPGASGLGNRRAGHSAVPRPAGTYLRVKQDSDRRGQIRGESKKSMSTEMPGQKQGIKRRG